MPGNGSLRMWVQTAGVGFAVGWIRGDPVDRSWKMRRVEPFHVFAQNTDAGLHAIGKGVDTGEVGQFRLNFNTDDIGLSVTVCQNQGDDAAPCTQIQDDFTGTWSDVIGEDDGVER